MKEGTGSGELVVVCRQELYEDYMNCCRQWAEVGPCRDKSLLTKAAQFLQRESELAETFTLFPFYKVLNESCGLPGKEGHSREPVCALVKAFELLETLCVNLFLQPWRKEIKTLKTFTGPFVYCLQPALGNSTIQSVLASIGYLPRTENPLSEYRLSEDAHPDTAILVGFELLLARVKCLNLLARRDKDQLGPQEFLEVFQRTVEGAQEEALTEKKTATEQRGEEEEEEEEKKEEAARKEVPRLDTKVAVKPQPKPRRSHFISADQSILEMQRTYPDLAFRGRPLLPDKPHRVNSGRSSSKADDLCRRDVVRDSRGRGRHEGGAAEVLGADGRSSDPKEKNSDRSGPGDSRGRADELSHDQSASLHITLRAGITAEQALRPESTPPTTEQPAHTQQPITADVQHKRLTKPRLSSSSSTDEEQERRELAELAGRLSQQGNTEETKGEPASNKERKASTKRVAEDPNLTSPVMETSPALSHATGRYSRSSQVDHPPALLTDGAADCQRSQGGSTRQHEGDSAERAQTGQGEEEHLAHSYVMVEQNKKF
ncbi:uncharacterized protein V6R79_020651 [Siganus canaliculatus]